MRPPCRWQLEELQLVGGGPVTMSDQQLAALLQLPDASAPPAGGNQVELPQRAGSPGPMQSAAAPPRLRALALSNARGLTDDFLAQLAAAGGAGGLQLRHLRLEDCWVPPPGSGCSSCTAACPAQAPPQVAWRPAFTPRALQRLLAASPGLLSLRLRHASAPLETDFLLAAAEACPLLQHVLLDECDLRPGGVALAPDPYGALDTLQVRATGQPAQRAVGRALICPLVPPPTAPHAQRPLSCGAARAA